MASYQVRYDIAPLVEDLRAGKSIQQIFPSGNHPPGLTLVAAEAMKPGDFVKIRHDGQAVIVPLDGHPPDGIAANAADVGAAVMIFKIEYAAPTYTLDVTPTAA